LTLLWQILKEIQYQFHKQNTTAYKQMAVNNFHYFHTVAPKTLVSQFCWM